MSIFTKYYKEGVHLYLTGYFFFIIIFSYPYMEKVLFWDQILKMKILVDLHVSRASESENPIFSCKSVCVCKCAYVCLLLA